MSLQIDVEVASKLMNRNQWYDFNCKFTLNDKPLFVGYPILVDPLVSFCDLRKREDSVKPSDKTLTLNVLSYCEETGSKLQKCEKCQHQDRTVANRKRKRSNEAPSASSPQESKLVQIKSLGNQVDHYGTFHSKMRVTCCIGATRQFHYNHCEGESDSVVIHKSCTGFSLLVILVLGEKELGRKWVKGPLRVIGKINKGSELVSGTPQPSDDKNAESPHSSEPGQTPVESSTQGHSLEEDTVEDASLPEKEPAQKEPRQKESIQTYSSMAETSPSQNLSIAPYKTIPIRSNLFQRDDLPVIDVLEYPVRDIMSILQQLDHFGNSNNLYSEAYETAAFYNNHLSRYWPLAVNRVFQQEFYLPHTLDKVTFPSTELLCLCNVLWVGTSVKQNSWMKETISEKLCSLEESMVKHLLNEKLSDLSRQELLELADTITRVSLVLTIHGRVSSAMYFLDSAYQLFEELAHVDSEIRLTPYYAVMMWHRICIYPTVPRIKEAYNWCHTTKYCQSYVYFMTIVSTIFPGFFKGKHSPIESVQLPTEPDKEKLLLYCSQLESSLKSSNVDSLLIYYAISSLRYWIEGDIQNSFKALEECTIRTSIYLTPFQELLPPKIASFVAVLLLGYSLTSSNPSVLNRKELRRVTHFIQILIKTCDKALFRSWATIFDSFLNQSFHNFYKLLMVRKK
eukprot:TRINITY_DN7562_c0_g1_i1.p1 TRINITY_DN7562_c0_g1~~TRINITY_DN7562_c0_g1_i1.p1  ORF type:complete len:681 (-),score=124.72 TRINITY_DN7562_c0_g1_i1:110-2152(-)